MAGYALEAFGTGPFISAERTDVPIMGRADSASEASPSCQHSRVATDGERTDLTALRWIYWLFAALWIVLASAAMVLAVFSLRRGTAGMRPAADAALSLGMFGLAVAWLVLGFRRGKVSHGAPPGWYPDPARTVAWRWWDGSRWSDLTA